jgi:alanyl-tRNA synthetase
MMTSSEIRQKFMDFFVSKGHVIVPSAPIVVKYDPTLMFTNAGMNQFKDIFLGNKTSPHKRVVDTQKCLRVSGKHNDLEEVGVDTYHHTMFEMLGNWSFGDYFKKEAIAWSWELLTEVYGIPKDRLYVSVFEGDAKENLPSDEEAYDAWKNWLSEDRILFGSKKDNFWEMGDTGPCGPCSEVHVDCRPDEERKLKPGRDLVNEGHPQVIEIWNNVFIQFNRLKDGSLEPLPEKHVDTGMGLERLVRVLQGKNSNYDTDLFTGTMAATEMIVRKEYERADTKKDIAFRVIADHVRAIAFTIADGQLPSNTGAGYVIRRILRRAVRYYFSYLDYKQPLLFQLMPVLAKQFENVFPELHRQVDFVSKVVKEEEEGFLKTLEKGILRFNNYATKSSTPVSGGYVSQITDDRKTKQLYEDTQIKYYSYRKNQIISGEFAFELYDTYGFPIDLTQLMAKEIGWAVDMEGFEKSLQQQRNRSRAATAVDTEDWIVLDEKATNEFVGYEDLNVTTRVLKYRGIKSKGREQFQLVLETTPFYAESGGQVGDTGKLYFNDEVIEVTDTKKDNELIVHYTQKLPADISAPVKAVVNAAKRLETACNHTATHLLHAALRKVLGPHVQQKGSLVNSEHLRFDFSHFSKMSDEDLRAVELMVNDKIRENIRVEISYLPKEEALAKGAMALFGEKYSDIVRVIMVDPAFSVELCGGTHVFYTGMIGTFKILSESATAAGVRRIEAITGIAAQNYFFDQLKSIKEIAAILKTSDPVKSLKQLVEEKNELEKKVENLENSLLTGIKNQLLQQVEEVKGARFIGAEVDVISPESLKKLCYQLRNELGNYLIVLCANIGGKPSVAICINEKITEVKALDAGKIIKEHVAPLIKGGGGGQKTLATAGGQDASNLKKVIDTVRSLL